MKHNFLRTRVKWFTMQTTIVSDERPMAPHKRHIGYDEWKVEDEPRYIEVRIVSWEMK